MANAYLPKHKVDRGKLKTLNLCQMPKLVFSTGERAAEYDHRTDCIYIGTNSSTKCLKFHMYKALIHSTIIKSRCPRDTEYIATSERLHQGWKTYSSVIEELNGIIGSMVLMRFHGHLDAKTITLVKGFFEKFLEKGIELNPRKSPRVKVSWPVIIATCKHYLSEDNHRELEKSVNIIRTALRKDYKGRFK